MKVFGISLVRNERDVIMACLLHSLSLGLDQLLVIDNGSTDGTTELLAELSKADPRLRWRRDESPFRQSEMATGLAREAWQAGADWVMSIDADEFWFAPGGSFRSVLERCHDEGLTVDIVNFVQRRSQVKATSASIMHMTCRAPDLIPASDFEETVTSNTAAFVEGEYPRKVISRARPEMIVAPGAHWIFGLEGAIIPTAEILCLHAPLRSKATLYAKALVGSRLEEAGVEGHDSWHIRRWHRLSQAALLDAEWEANSYQDGRLSVYGQSHRLVRDYRLRNLVAPWVRKSPLARFKSWFWPGTP